MSTYRPGGFQILPPVIKNLLIINVIVFMAANMLGETVHEWFYQTFSLYHWSSPFFRPWQFVTHMFMHGEISEGGLSHLFFNMFALWMFGNVVENVLGTRKFIIFYLACGVGAAICYLGVFTWEHYDSISWFKALSDADQYDQINRIMTTGAGNPLAFPMFTPMVGASGAVFGLLFAFGYLFPNMMIYIYFLFPLKAKYFVAIYAIIELLAGLRGSPGDNVAHFAHIGGMLFAFILLRMWNRNNRNTYYY